MVPSGLYMSKQHLCQKINQKNEVQDVDLKARAGAGDDEETVDTHSVEAARTISIQETFPPFAGCGCVGRLVIY